MIDYRENTVSSEHKRPPLIGKIDEVIAMYKGTDRGIKDGVSTIETVCEVADVNSGQVIDLSTATDFERDACSYLNAVTTIAGKGGICDVLGVAILPQSIYERKTPGDLESSLVPDDRGEVRFIEQSMKMFEMGKATACDRWYILDEYFTYHRDNLPIRGKPQAFFKKRLQRAAKLEGFHIAVTENPLDVAVHIYVDTLINYEEKIRPKSWCHFGPDCNFTYDDVSMPSSDDVEIVFRRQLQILRGVSPNVAKAIVAKYPCMNDLIVAYNEHVAPETMLTNLPVEGRALTKNGKTPRVGPAISRKVWNLVGKPVVKIEPRIDKDEGDAVQPSDIPSDDDGSFDLEKTGKRQKR